MDDGICHVKIPSLRFKKRLHKKSRTGCITCKKRRIKCDETQPCCKRCSLRGINCTWQHEKSSSSPPELNANEESSCQTAIRDPAGILDNDLAKHFFTHTAESFAASTFRQESSVTWRVFMPAAALICPVVRRGTLTLAAMCMHNDSLALGSGESASRYLEAAEAHGTVFVAESRQKLQDLNESEIDSVIACSRLLCVLGFAFFRIHRRNGFTLIDNAAWTWLRLLRGVRATYIALVESGQRIDEMIVNDMVPELPSTAYSHISLPPSTGLHCVHPCFDFFMQSRQERFEALHRTLDESWLHLGDQKVGELNAAINRLADVTEHVCSQRVNSLFRAMCTWPGDVPMGYIDALMDVFAPAHAPALAIYAHWLMVVVLAEDLWWVGDMGRAGINDVTDLCSDASPEVFDLLLWPTLMLEIGRA